jgi:uncharacterized protein involved in oxidation of intracellular sulfur
VKTLFILNDAPQSSERTFNGSRLACALAGTEGTELRMFLMGDAAAAAVRSVAPAGERTLEALLSQCGAAVRIIDRGVRCLHGFARHHPKRIAGRRAPRFDGPAEQVVRLG